jgi:Uma2 family endonuclease
MGLPKPILTEDEYLKFERAAPERHIFIDGELFSMAGESWRHGDISANILASLYNQLDDTPCRVRIKDTKVRSGPMPRSGTRTAGMYSYPDVVVICGEPEHLDAYTDVILNPKVIVEVLSESTEEFDRGEKFERYKLHNSTLTDYVLVSQDQPRIEHHHREPDGTWSEACHDGLKATVKLAAIKCRLKAVDVYKRIAFTNADD